MGFVDIQKGLGNPRATWWSVSRKLSVFAGPINII